MCTMPQMKKIKLILEDKTVLEGESFGADISTNGEVVFNTGMVGYPEALTDPSYRGQILVMTYPLVGNYGVPGNQKDQHGIHKFFESPNMQIKALVVSEYSENYNHWNAKQSLGDWLKKNNIPGITGIDTRKLTQKLREKGAMLGKIVVEEDVEFHDPNLDNLVAEVSIKKPVTYKGGKKTIVCIDCGVKNNSIRNILKRGYNVRRVPWDYDFIEAGEKFDGVYISNGPGDPMLAQETVEIMKKCIKLGKPIFGICLGAQIMALAVGGKTYKMKYGHRAQNQPCTDLQTGRCYITSQNHGFAIREKSLPKGWEVWLKNTNDNTVEGIRHKTKPFFATQFHPESSPGPLDTEDIFDKFLELV